MGDCCSSLSSLYVMILGNSHFVRHESTSIQVLRLKHLFAHQGGPLHDLLLSVCLSSMNISRYTLMSCLGRSNRGTQTVVDQRVTDTKCLVGITQWTLDPFSPVIPSICKSLHLGQVTISHTGTTNGMAACSTGHWGTLNTGRVGRKVCSLATSTQKFFPILGGDIHH